MSQMLNCANSTVFYVLKGEKKEEEVSGNLKLISYILCQ